MAIENLITDHLDLWTAAVRPKSSAGRGSNSKLELTGIKKLRELILEMQDTLTSLERCRKPVLAAIILQAANTGLTGGSTPDGNDYGRPIVLISTLRLTGVQLLDEQNPWQISRRGHGRQRRSDADGGESLCYSLRDRLGCAF